MTQSWHHEVIETKILRRYGHSTDLDLSVQRTSTMRSLYRLHWDQLNMRIGSRSSMISHTTKLEVTRHVPGQLSLFIIVTKVWMDQFLSAELSLLILELHLATLCNLGIIPYPSGKPIKNDESNDGLENELSQLSLNVGKQDQGVKLEVKAIPSKKIRIELEKLMMIGECSCNWTCHRMAQRCGKCQDVASKKCKYHKMSKNTLFVCTLADQVS